MSLLHQKIELHTDLSAEEAAAVIRSELKNPASGFHGKEQNEEFRIDYKQRIINAFRPEITLSMLPEEEGCLLWSDMKLPAAMLGFMLFWTLIPVVFGIVKHNWLVLVVIPVFWIIAVVAFRMGVRSAKQALMTLFGAYEITG